MDSSARTSSFAIAISSRRGRRGFTWWELSHGSVSGPRKSRRHAPFLECIATVTNCSTIRRCRSLTSQFRHSVCRPHIRERRPPTPPGSISTFSNPNRAAAHRAGTTCGPVRSANEARGTSASAGALMEGTEGLARGTIGWPSYRTHTPNSLDFTTKRLGNDWIRPHWSEAWFREAFWGTMALVDAGFRGVQEHRIVELPEIRGL